MSLSASAENLKSQPKAYDGSANMCLELALEGERLCKAGDCRAGVAFFQAAIQAGTDDLRTLSAIYSQLGNAYYYLDDYTKAMQYHTHDLTLARTMGDKLGEAKAAGNLGNTLKALERFDEAALYCKKHLDIAREIKDVLCEGRALYNLGNVYHSKGKQMGIHVEKDPGEFSDDIITCLKQAVDCYEENLSLMREVGDVAAQGRACGNLGNTYYLMGDFETAIKYHEERLAIARQFGDRIGERRAHSNLGNAYIFMGKFSEAATHYKLTLAIAQELEDRAIEAQACFSLGNTHSLMRDYATAIDYHLRHLLIAQHLGDNYGESRAHFALANAHASLFSLDKTIEYADKYAKLMDRVGGDTSKLTVKDLRKIMNADSTTTTPSDSESSSAHILTPETPPLVNNCMFRMTPDGKQKNMGILQPSTSNQNQAASDAADNDDSFFDLLSQFQSKRMDDQRCVLNRDNKENNNPTAKANSNPNVLKKEATAKSLSNPKVPKEESIAKTDSNPNIPKESPPDLLDMIVGMQRERMDEQRAALPSLPIVQIESLPKLSECNNKLPDENFLDQLSRCQSSRLDDQRSQLPARTVSGKSDPNPTPPITPNDNVGEIRGSTVPDEEFVRLIYRFQSARMDDQRAAAPPRNRNVANGTIPKHLQAPLNYDNKS